MIDKIFEDYEKQQRKYLRDLMKTLELDIPEIISVFPKSNHDIEEIFKSIHLIEEDDDICERLEVFYIDTMKRGILSSIPLGKTFMVKLYRDDRKRFDELTQKDSSLLLKYVPEIESKKDLADNIRDKKFNMDYENLTDDKKFSLIVESVLYSFCEFTDENKMMIDYHYNELFNILDIDLKLAKKKTNKRIKLGPKSNFTLISAIYKDMEGKFRVSDLVRDHCTSIFQEGMRLGIRNGIKIVIDDVQMEKINPEEFSKMTMEELSIYFYKEINDYLDELVAKSMD